MKPEYFESLPYPERGPARIAFIKANKDSMSIAELAAVTGVGVNTVSHHICRLEGKGRFAEGGKHKIKQKKDVLSGRATWPLYKKRNQLHDDFRGWF